MQSSITHTLATNVENLTLTGSGAINGTGSSAANTIVGNSGANTLNGGTGLDALTGGAGNDVFHFDTALGAGNLDSIADFNVPADTMQLENAVFAALTTTGTLTTAAFYIGAAAHDADDRIVYNATTGALLYDADGTGAAAAIQFAALTIVFRSPTRISS